MTPEDSTRPTFGQPGWRRRTESRYGWDREFAAAVAGALAVLLFSIGLAHGDENTGTPADPKEMVTSDQDAGCSTDITFLPLPSWASAKMPPLPGQLTPMGTPTILHKPSPAAVAETKPDTPPMPKKLPQVYPLASSKDPAPAANDSPALMAVSPFLQWIKDHPAGSRDPGRARKPTVIVPARPLRAAAASRPGPGASPYWMPPMIDSSPVAAVQAGESGNGSAAIYSTPQR